MMQQQGGMQMGMQQQGGMPQGGMQMGGGIAAAFTLTLTAHSCDSQQP